MNESGLIEQVLRIINSNYSNIYVIDILSDIVYSFDFNVANSLTIKETMTYTDFVESAKKFIYAEDLNNYFAAISLNKLEIESQKGNQETKVKYRKLSPSGEYRFNVNIINYLPYEGKKLIFMMSEDINSRLVDTEEKVESLTKKTIEYQNRLNEESESIGNAILEINNILDMKTNNDNISTRNYINSVFNRVSNSHPELNQAITKRMVRNTNIGKPAILIVDDSSIMRNSLKRIFANDYEIVMAKNGSEAIELITKNILNRTTSQDNVNIVGILLDLIMPGVDGFAVLDFLKNFNLLNKIPVAIISGDETKETRRKVYEYDIVDMLEKPFNTDNIRRRISKIISMYMASDNLKNIIASQDRELSNVSQEKYEGLSIIIQKMVENVINSESSIRMKKMVREIAIELQNMYPQYNLDTRYIDNIVSTAPLYNIGSLAIPFDSVVSIKNIKESIEFGLVIINNYISDQDELRVASNIVKYSFEMYNGMGYPNNIRENDIPIEAQIVNVVARMVKSNKSFATTFKTITDTESTKYNPAIIDVLKQIKKTIKDI